MCIPTCIRKWVFPWRQVLIQNIYFRVYSTNNQKYYLHSVCISIVYDTRYIVSRFLPVRIHFHTFKIYFKLSIDSLAYTVICRQYQNFKFHKGTTKNNKQYRVHRRGRLTEWSSTKRNSFCVVDTPMGSILSVSRILHFIFQK